MDSILSKKACISPPVKSLLGSKLPTPTKQYQSEEVPRNITPTATITSPSHSISPVEKPITSIY